MSVCEGRVGIASFHTHGLVSVGTWYRLCAVLYIASNSLSAEHSFSKLKLIKSYLRSTLAQDRLDSLALISIENEAAAQLQLDAVVDRFAEAEARKEHF